MNNFSVFLNKILDSKIARRLLISMIYCCFLVFFLYVSAIKDYFFPSSTLYVYGFVDMFHPETISDFEKKYKTKVLLRYFESNEELLAKFKINKGIGYDVIVSSDYMVRFLHQENLLYKLDQKKLSNQTELDPRLMGKHYDLKNIYSMPYSWIPYGIIFRKDIYEDVPDEVGLELLFTNPKLLLHGIKNPYRLCMTDDSREAMFLADLYLFNLASNYSPERVAELQELLIKQKAWVESYLNQDLAYPLLSGLIQVAYTPLFAVDKVLKSSEKFAFMLPREGSLFAIENLAIPVTCKKIDLAHKFINFCLSCEEQSRMSNFYGMNPSNKLAYKFLDQRRVENKHIFPDDEKFAKLHLTPYDTPIKVFEDVWLAVKSS